MRILCLSKEKEFLRQVGTVFADRIVELDTREDSKEFLTAAANGNWDVYYIDFDVLQASYSNPVEFIKMLQPNTKVLIVGSSSFSDWHHELRSLGAVVLHKPTTIGEVGLGLRKIAAGQKRKRGE